MSTADDMSRFMLAHLNNGRFENAQILAPETTRLMHATAFVPMAGAQGVAFGFFVTIPTGTASSATMAIYRDFTLTFSCCSTMAWASSPQ